MLQKSLILNGLANGGAPASFKALPLNLSLSCCILYVYGLKGGNEMEMHKVYVKQKKDPNGIQYSAAAYREILWASFRIASEAFDYTTNLKQQYPNWDVRLQYTYSPKPERR